MKKILALMMVLACVFCWSFTSAEGLDFAAMSDEQLKEIIDGATAELSKRNTEALDGVLIDQDGVKLYLTGEYEITEYDADNIYVEMSAIIENHREETIWITTNSMSINSWEVYADGFPTVSPNNNRKCVLSFCISDANISEYEELEEMVVVFEVLNDDTYDTLFVIDPITLTF